MDNIIYKKVKKYFEDNKKTIIDELEELIKIPSVNNHDSEYIFGTEVNRALEAGAALAAKYGFEAKVKGSYAIAHFGKGSKSIGLFGHLDVVPANEKDWVYTKPFLPFINDGFIIGRGSEDDKAAIVIGCHVAAAIREIGISLGSEITLFMGGNEECGMRDIADFVQNEKMPDISIIPDNEFPVCIGEKGICCITAKCRMPFESIRRIYGGMAHNVVLGEVAAELDYDDITAADLLDAINKTKDIKAEVNKEGINVKAFGVSAHAAYPENSFNAGINLADLLCGFNRISENDKKILRFMRSVQERPYGEPFGIESEDEHFGKLTAVNGIVRTENGQLVLLFDIRYGTSVENEKMLKKIIKVFDENGWDVRIDEDEEGFELPCDSETVKAFENIYNAVSGEKFARADYSGGGTYARKLKNAYSVGTSIYNGEGGNMPVGHGGAHQSDECISVEGMLLAAQAITLMVIEADEQLNKEI
ncbi:MAG: Sapep family Mn(2+)-dependent dipeptidase [Bacillota bacterium]|nr:Sapep family Mn(2+)-dependent dipeptidase [Bacillota bacterium]